MQTSAMPKVKSMMTAFPWHVSGQTSLEEARQLMADKQIHHLVITREDGSYSLLSERDLQHHGALYGGKVSRELVVGDVASDAAICADLDDPVDRILDAMAERHIGSVVVLRRGELAGIFTTTDACRHFADYLREQHHPDDDPDLIA